MKNTIRVHKNRSAATSAPQAKTSLRKSGQENITLVFKDEAGKADIEFEVPKPFYAAMARSAKVKGVSLEQWIEDAVRLKVLKGKGATIKKAEPINDDEISLVLFSQKQGTSIAHVDVTRDDMINIRRRATNSLSTLDKMLADGLKHISRNEVAS